MITISYDVLFSVLFALLVIQRLLELWLSRNNEREVLAKGGKEFFPRHFLFMKVVHVGWFISMLIEFTMGRPLMSGSSWIWLGLFLLGQFLRVWAIRTLEWRWTVKIMAVPDCPPVVDGPFRYFRHPNYAGVILELAAAPLIFGLWKTAVIFSLLNAWVLYIRIRCEEKALEEFNNYQDHMPSSSRFIPGRGRH